MNKNILQKIILIFYLFFILLLISTCEKKTKFIKIPTSEIKDDFISYLNTFKIDYDKNEKYFTLYNTKESITGLLTLLEYISIQLNITNENIININTTRCLDTKSYYIRQYVEIDENLNIIVKQDNSNKPLIIHDPSHPDAIKKGNLKGFVLYPNISKPKEVIDLIVFRRLYIVIGNIIKEFDENFYLFFLDPLLDYNNIYGE